MDLLDRQDVMQVCRNGHVITDLLQTFPERALGHCDRCGAGTFDRCLTCGQLLPGAVYVPEAPPVGRRRPPQYCSGCGAAFPWTQRSAAQPGPGAFAVLENLLRRVPLVIRQLRFRQGERPAFSVRDENDLEDLLRALLPLHFDDIRLESRIPAYASGTRTDFLLGPSGIVVVAKVIMQARAELPIHEELAEDARYYGQGNSCRTLACFVYDPEGRIGDPRGVETVWSRLAEVPVLRAVIAS